MYINYISFNNRFIVGEDFIFKEENITYLPHKELFNVYFNNKLGVENLKKRNFKIRYKGKKVLIKSVDVLGPKHAQVKIDDYDGSMAEVLDDDMKGILFEMKGFKDFQGRTVNKAQTVTGYQFREFFAQEIFDEKSLDRGLKFIQKNAPLNFADLNAYNEAEKYIINSPLETRRFGD